jgi:hypothetical protein
MPLSASSAAAEEEREKKKTKSSERRDSEKEKPEEREHLRIGPLVGLGFPRPLAIEGFAKIEKVVGVGLEYSLLPRMNIAGADTSFKALAVDARVFPFRGAFFLGARVGRQWLDAKTTITVGQLGSFTESMSATTWFVNPRLGFLFTWASGITLGVDAGVQFPINPTYERSGPATTAGVAQNTGVNQTLASVAGTLGNNVTPTVDLLRVGFLF